MQPGLILLVLAAAGIAQPRSVEEASALEDENSFLQMPTRLQPNSKAAIRHAKSRAAIMHQARDPADWPTPDDPDLTVTDTDRLMVKTFKSAADDKNVTLINATIASMALTPVGLVIDEGVYDYIFQVLRDYQGDEYQYLQQHAWRALSDQSWTERGSHLIANHGGPHEGVKFMVDQLLVHPLRYGYCEDQLTTQYEILACLSGLLLTDNNNTRGPAAVEEGLVPGVMRALMGEPDLLPTQYMACRVMQYLFFRNPQYVRLFKEAGAEIYTQQAWDRFSNGSQWDDMPFYFGQSSMGEYYNISACEYPLGMMMLDDIRDEWHDWYQDWKPWLDLQYNY